MLSDFRGEVWVNVHPDILDMMVKINSEAIDGGYGKDSYAEKATALMQKNFDKPIYTTFAINGTAANVMAMKAMLDSWSSILCAKQAHINTYEAGATEFNLGNKILPIESKDGKLTVELVEELLLSITNYKYNPKVIALAQPTEYGTVYTVDELKKLCDFAHKNGLYVYMDGARLANAIISLGTDLKTMVEYTGVDAFSFGGTKASAMFGEMVVFMCKEFDNYLQYSQKQSLQHMSKSKFLSAQICIIIEEELWLKNAVISNNMAKLLEKKLRNKNIEIYYKVESNMVFCVLEPDSFERVKKIYDLHYWNYSTHVVRLATTYLTTEEQINNLISLL